MARMCAMGSFAMQIMPETGMKAFWLHASTLAVEQKKTPRFAGLSKGGGGGWIRTIELIEVRFTV